jgi:hypothetical protein
VLGQDLLVEPALAEKGLPTAWFAPTYRMMLDTFREVADTLRPVASKINASDHRIELVTGGVIDMWSLDVPDVARGRKYKRVIPWRIMWGMRGFCLHLRGTTISTTCIRGNKRIATGAHGRIQPVLTLTYLLVK